MSKGEDKKELLKYIINILEPKNTVFGNLPICPFVKKERLKDKILFENVVFGNEPTIKIIKIIKNTFSKTDENTLLAYDTVSQLGALEFIDYGKRLCEIFLKEKIISISLHPSDTFNIHGQLTRTVPFHTMLIQTASQIIAAKKILQGSNYYENWTKEDLEDNYKQFAQYL